MQTEIPYKLLAKYFANECSPNEKQELKKWKAQNSENMNIYKQFEIIHKQENPMESNPDTEKALSKVWQKIDSGDSKTVRLQSRQTMMNVLRIAAVLLLFLTVFAIYKYMQTDIVECYAVNQNQELKLGDGSVINLKKGAKLLYPEEFSSDERRVQLIGEAYFEIAKNPEKPFIIDVENSSITVLGTEFNVRALSSEKEVIVTVTEGKVAFESCEKSSKVELTAGEKGVLEKQTNVVKKTKNNNANYMSWKTGIFNFQNTPLKKAAKILSDYYGKTVIIKSELSISGTYEKRSLDEMISIISLTHSLKIEKQGDKIILK